ncbi:MAG: DivIVA domain-containing protein [Bacteroidetes bacterium]|nr:DivIVA domain-containing protein [Bacteroidota bacterium]
MKITPIEIRQKDFEKSFRGYNIEEVDAFLYSLSLAWQKLRDDFDKKENKIDKLTKELKRVKKLEEALVKNIEISKDTADSIIKNAEVEAKKIIFEQQENTLLKELKDIKNILKMLNFESNKV